jgi:hypothetical protein
MSELFVVEAGVVGWRGGFIPEVALINVENKGVLV